MSGMTPSQVRIPKALQILRWISSRSNVFVTALACWCGFGMMWVTFFDVFGRYVLNSPMPGATESGELLMVFMTFLCLGFVQIKGGHTAITMVTERLSRRWRTVLSVITTLVAAILFTAFAWQSALTAIESLRFREAFPTYPIPIYPAKWSVCIGFALLALQLWLDIADKLFTAASIVARTEVGTADEY